MEQAIPKTQLQIRNHILRKPCSGSYETNIRKTEQTHIPRNEHPGHQQNPHVQTVLQRYQTNV